MDSIELSLAFARIIGLVCNFINLRKDKSGDFKEFMEFIKEQNEEIAKHIQENSQISNEIKNMLEQDRKTLLSKLEDFDNLFVSISSSLSVIGNLAKVIKPGIKLSDQSISILKQLYNSGGSFFIEIPVKGSVILNILDASEVIDYNEGRFLTDDLNLLVEFDLLRHDVNSQGHNKYILTRNAAQLIESLE